MDSPLDKGGGLDAAGLDHGGAEARGGGVEAEDRARAGLEEQQRDDAAREAQRRVGMRSAAASRGGGEASQARARRRPGRSRSGDGARGQYNPRSLAPPTRASPFARVTHARRAADVRYTRGGARTCASRARRAALRERGRAGLEREQQALAIETAAVTVRDRSAPITRWQGTMIAIGLRLLAPPTARAAPGCPTAARDLAVGGGGAVGIARRARQTSSWKGARWGRARGRSLGARRRSTRRAGGAAR